jgi:hypothetical protein
MTPSGLYQMVAARGAAAGLPPLHPDQFRHSFAAGALLLERLDPTRVASCVWWKRGRTRAPVGASYAAVVTVWSTTSPIVGGWVS